MSNLNTSLLTVAAWNLRFRGGKLATLLLLTVGWVALTISWPAGYFVASVGYIAMIATATGSGLRMYLTSHRAYLVPNLMTATRIYALGLLLLALVATVAAAPSGLPAVGSAAVFWVFGLVWFYGAALSRSIFVLFGQMFLLGALVAIMITAVMISGEVGGFFTRGAFDSPWFAGLLLIDVLLTVLVWQRIGTLREPAWPQPGAPGQQSLFEIKDRRSPSRSLDAVTGHVPSGLWGRARHFRFITFAPKGRNLVAVVFFWSALGVVLLPSLDSTIFAIPVMWPILLQVIQVKTSPRMFMLPLSRSEIVKAWGVAIFARLMKNWMILSLPMILLLAVSSSRVPPLFLLGSLALQLPIFGATMAAAPRLKTVWGAAFFATMMLHLFLFGGLGVRFLWTHPGALVLTTLASLVLGPLLIWVAYRRWCETEMT